MQTQAEGKKNRRFGRLTIFDSPEQILEVKTGLVFAEGFISRHLHHSPEYINTFTGTHKHTQLAIITNEIELIPVSQ